MVQWGSQIPCCRWYSWQKTSLIPHPPTARHAWALGASHSCEMHTCGWGSSSAQLELSWKYTVMILSNFFFPFFLHKVQTCIWAEGSPPSPAASHLEFKGMCAQSLNHVWLCDPMDCGPRVASLSCPSPLLSGYPRQEYWSGLPFPFPGDLSDQGYNLGCLQVDSLPSEPQGKPQMSILCPLNPILTSGARSCSRKWTGRLGLESAQYLPVDKENVILSIMGGEGSSWCKERPSR